MIKCRKEKDDKGKKYFSKKICGKKISAPKNLSPSL